MLLSGVTIVVVMFMVTLACWVESWIERRSIRLAPSTISGYRGSLRKYIAPSPVGAMPLDQIAPEDLIVLLSPILGKGYTRQAQLVQILIGAALRDAVRQRIIPWSPMDCVDKVRHKSQMTAWLTPDQAAELLRAARAAADPFYPAWLLGICCGLRRGEILGLRWTDVDFAGCVLHVRRQLIRIDGQLLETAPKSLSSVRDVPLPSMLADQLRFLRQGERVVVATPDALQRALDAACARADVPRITLHGLRHSMAAVAATEGVLIKVLQEIMGHAQYTTTADVYAHVDRKAVQFATRKVVARLEIV